MPAIDEAIEGLRLDLETNDLVDQNPLADARFDELISLIERLLRSKGSWRNDERLVVFTEYKTTLDYLIRRLREKYEPERILTLFGGMDEIERNLVKNAFNDPSHEVRLLLATDAAAEGLNLQRTARYLLHFDCPWNPSKLEQRNGRIDRHGQARDVTLHHFVSDQDQDLRFLAHIIAKAHDIREDLGSANELFDEASHRRLVEGESLASVQADLDLRIEAARGRAAFVADDSTDTGKEGLAAVDQLRALAAEMDLDPQSLRDTLEAAMAIRVGRPQLDCPAGDGTCKVINPSLPGWNEVIDDSLRRATARDSRGPVARLAFSPDPFLEKVGGRLVFSPLPDVFLMHLSHPMLQQAISMLTRRRYPGTGDAVSRWTIRLGDVPKGADALLFLSVEELALNELRETFHHWVRTLVFPVKKGKLGDRLGPRPAMEWRAAQATSDPKLQDLAIELIEEVEPDLKTFLAAYAKELSAKLRHQLEAEGGQARKQEDERYRSRQGEVSALIAENTLAKLEREISKLKAERNQGFLFEAAERLDAIDRSIQEKQEEVARRKRNYEEVRAQLDRERDRILKYLFPKRHSMAGKAQVFPICIEVRLPGGQA